MFAEQAIFTSLVRRGKSGYHLVARSPGVTESEANALAAWSPSHGALILDGANRASVNFHPLPSGRFALSRTREGRPEYSGRGGRQLYTHALVFDAGALRAAGFRPFAIYRDARAQGHFRYRVDPPAVLPTAPLSVLHPKPAADPFAGIVRELGPAEVDSLVAEVVVGRPVVFPYPGDRAALAECLLDRMPPDAVVSTSFATSLQPSTVRPFRLTLVDPR